MADPALHLLAGPNGAGKTTLYERVIKPDTGLLFVNADVIAARRWPGEEVEHAYEASRLAAQIRSELLAKGISFATETVFSHESKLQLVNDAAARGYRTTLHVVLISEALAVARVADRVLNGGHAVPEDKIHERYQRLWDLVAEAIAVVDQAHIYDNSQIKTPLRRVATFKDGHLVQSGRRPTWTPVPIAALLG